MTGDIGLLEGPVLALCTWQGRRPSRVGLLGWQGATNQGRPNHCCVRACLPLPPSPPPPPVMLQYSSTHIAPDSCCCGGSGRAGPQQGLTAAWSQGSHGAPLLTRQRRTKHAPAQEEPTSLNSVSALSRQSHTTLFPALVHRSPATHNGHRHRQEARSGQAQGEKGYFWPSGTF